MSNTKADTKPDQEQELKDQIAKIQAQLFDLQKRKMETKLSQVADLARQACEIFESVNLAHESRRVFWKDLLLDPDYPEKGLVLDALSLTVSTKPIRRSKRSGGSGHGVGVMVEKVYEAMEKGKEYLQKEVGALVGITSAGVKPTLDKLKNQKRVDSKKAGTGVVWWRL